MSFPVFAQTEVNSFELFWPIVAGKVAGESLYPLKTLKENIREKLIFSSSKKADYFVFLSEKRIVEAEKLILEKKNENAKRTLEAGKKARERAVFFAEKAAKKSTVVVGTKERLVGSLEKQVMLLDSMLTKIEGNEKQLVNDTLTGIESELNALQ
jgi:hypothetical protein